MSWPVVKLHDICRPKQWKTIAASNLLESGYPVYGANGKIGFYSEFTHESPTLMITCRGATCGNVHISEPKSYINGNAMALDDIDSSAVDLKYLYYFFLKRGFDDVISGSAQPQITGQGLTKVEIPLPPPTEQKRIAAILDKADAIRRKRQQAIQLADEFLRAVFLDMFGDPVTNPKGWETKTIEQLISPEKYALKRGPFGGALKKEIFVEDGYLVYEQYHALNGDFSYQRYFIDEEKYEELKAFNVKPKDIIVSCSGVNLGRLAEVPDCAPSGIINQALMKITLNQELIANKLFIDIFSNPSFKKAFYGDFRGAAIPNFPPMSTFKEFEFIVPPIDLQNKYISIREKLLDHSAYSEEMDSLKLFEALSQKAFSGYL